MATNRCPATQLRTGRGNAMDLVPVVDISNPGATSLAALDKACRDHGFFLLEGHGLDAVIAETFAAARQFFDADRVVKNDVRRDAQNPLGYNDRELTKRRRDHKEVFDLVDPTEGRAKHYNRWPKGLPGFMEAIERHYNACSDLAHRTTELVFEALGLPEQGRSTHRGDRTTSNLRLNHYTMGDPVPETDRESLADLGDVALGQHTDLGLLTLLIQDDVGGLQAESPEHGWIDVEPRPGTIVVNLADCMQVWTNDQYKAAVHRVLPMTVSTRMSIPYFLNPARDAMIQPISGLVSDAPLYRPFPFREFIDARGADNYADAGTPDAQISDFRVSVGSKGSSLYSG
jgi:isopenicillin N synthase-like dioxygenase